MIFLAFCSSLVVILSSCSLVLSLLLVTWLVLPAPLGSFSQMRLTCIVNFGIFRLALALLVGARLGVRSWLLCFLWLFEFLRLSLVCCLVSLWLEPCVGKRFVLCVLFEVARASARLVRFALSFCCEHWFLSPRYLFATSLYESTRRKPG